MNEPNPTQNKFRVLCDYAEREMKRLPIPGAVLGISFEGRERVAAFGVTSLENPLPVTEDTLFQIGSITKTFLATAVMRLVESGKLELDAPLRTYLPDLRLADESVAKRVTMRHLLTHTGGWVGDYFDDLGRGEDALANIVVKMAGLKQVTPLGEVWSYNNSGFYLAGRAIEVVAGKSFEAAIKELVFDPLGLTISFFFAEDVISHRFVVGHEVADGKPRVARPWALPRANHAAGGVICSVKDLLKYAHFQMGDGTALNGSRLLTRESMALMQTPMFPSTGISMMGLAWNIVELDGTRIIGHGGGTNGQSCLLRIVPEQGFAAAVLTNSEEGGSLYQPLVDLAVKEYLGVAMPEAVPLNLPSERLGEYPGKYEAAANLLEISAGEGGLVLKVTSKGGFPTPDSPPGPPIPLVRIALYGEDRVVVLDEPIKGARGEFLRDQAGRIKWLRLQSRLHARLD